MQDIKQQFKTKYEFLLNPDKPDSAVRKEFCRDLDKLILLAVEQEKARILELISDNKTSVKDPICLSGAKTREREIITLINNK